MCRVKKASMSQESEIWLVPNEDSQYVLRTSKGLVDIEQASVGGALEHSVWQENRVLLPSASTMCQIKDLMNLSLEI